MIRASSIPLLLAAAFLTTGCERETDVARANREGILLVGNSAEPRSLDLQLVSGVPEGKVLTSLFEGLVADHPSEDNTMSPGVATHWEHNDMLTEWTFHLNPNAKWSDGTPITTEDFIFSYHRMLNPELAAAYAPMLHAIKNAEAYNRNERGHILCGLDEAFPTPWETLKKANFQGIKSTAADDLAFRDFEDLTHAEQKTVLAAEGLDGMSEAQLTATLKDPSLFNWPETLPSDTRTLVLQRLLDHSQQGEPDLFDQANIGLASPDPHTLIVTLREPVPYLPAMTRHTSWFPVPRHVILKFGKMTDRFTDWSKLENLVGNGAFKIKEWRFNHYIEVERNPHYWDATNVGLNGIRYFPIENPYTETRSFLAGQLHTIYSLPPDLLERARNDYSEFLRTEPYVGTRFLRFNTTRPGLDNLKVRQAMSLAINREELCKYIYEGFQPATSLTPKVGNYEPPAVVEHNLEKAKALLTEAGYPNGEGLPSYSILTTRMNPSVDAMQHTFAKLGIRITVSLKDWGSYIASQQQLDYDISLAGWIGDYPDPTTFLDMWTRGNGNNNTGWSSTQYEALLRKAAQQPNPDTRFKTLAEAERLLLEEAPIAPMAYYVRLYLHRPEVKGWHPLLLDNHSWKAITLEPEP